MVFFINLLISVAIISICFFKRNSKVMFVIAFLWMWFLFSFNYGNADYEMYRGLYEGTVIRDIEPGTRILMDFFNSLGFSYHGFLCVFGAIGLGLIAYTIYKRSKNISFVAALYLIFPFVLDAIQIRNFIAMALIIFGINFLITQKRLWWLKYAVINLIAVSFHSFALVCFAFIPLAFMNRKKIWLVTSILFIFESCLIINKSLLLSMLSFVMDPERLNAYFGSGLYSNPGVSTIVISSLIIILSLAIITMARIRVKDKKLLKMINFSEKVFAVCVLLIPILFYSTTIMRLVRSMLLLVSIVFADSMFVHGTDYKYVNNGMAKKSSKADQKMLVSYVKKISPRAQILVSIGAMGLLIFAWNYAFIFGIDNTKSTYEAVLGNNIAESAILGEVDK